ncbi:hypothetical protein QP110_04390 [Aerococcus sp. UMB10185]|nr:hypothetical protein [Aerococcus sp. UMB10185]MDK6233499.1 hypothetical protein [Aerococcus sp. UMB10185]
MVFPDVLRAITQGKNIVDALYMASDCLGIHLADALERGQALPEPSPITSLSLDDYLPEDKDFHFDRNKSFISMVLVDLDDYTSN